MVKNSENLKKILKLIGLSQKDFAEQYYSYSIGRKEILDIESDKHYANFRKELSRNSKTNLEKYFSFLSTLKAFKDSKYTYDVIIYKNILSKALTEEMKRKHNENSSFD